MDSKVNRREFLKSLTAGSLTVFGAAFLPGCNKHVRKKDYH